MVLSSRGSVQETTVWRGVSTESVASMRSFNTDNGRFLPELWSLSNSIDEVNGLVVVQLDRFITLESQKTWNCVLVLYSGLWNTGRVKSGD